MIRAGGIFCLQPLFASETFAHYASHGHRPHPARLPRPCPGCGAPVEFKSAQSTHAVCGYRQSTVVRSGDVLTRLGKMAERSTTTARCSFLPAGASPSMARSSPSPDRPPAVQKATGVWTEWVAFLKDGSTASLGEDNGAYVFTRKIDPGRELPEASRFRLGATTAINGKSLQRGLQRQCATGVGPGRTAPTAAAGPTV